MYIINRDVTFDKTRMGMLSKDQKEYNIKETDRESTQFGVDLPIHHGNEERIRLEESHDQQAKPAPNDCHLAIDRVRRIIVPPMRFCYAYLI